MPRKKLDTYRAKRDFETTPEPTGTAATAPGKRSPSEVIAEVNGLFMEGIRKGAGLPSIRSAHQSHCLERSFGPGKRAHRMKAE